MTRKRTGRWHQQPYGSHWADLHPEAYSIWLRRDDEPGETPAFGMRALLVMDDEDDKRAVLSSQIWRLALRHLKRRELAVLRFRYVHDFTLDETGALMSVTRERIRQIETAALARLRRSIPRETIHRPQEGAR